MVNGGRTKLLPLETVWVASFYFLEANFGKQQNAIGKGIGGVTIWFVHCGRQQLNNLKRNSLSLEL